MALMGKIRSWSEGGMAWTTELGRRNAESLSAQRVRWTLWLPVAFGAGIGVYFALPEEPPLFAGIAAVLLALAVTWKVRDHPAVIAAVALLVAALGFLAAELRTARVAAPVLSKATGVTEVTGRILRISHGERGTSFVIAVHRIARLAESRTPARVRISWRGVWPGQVSGGDWVRVRAVLRPLPGQVAPGAFDFARYAYFRRIGALGFAVAPPGAISPPRPPGLGETFAGRLGAMRSDLAARFRVAMPESAAAIAVALATGERDSIAKGDLEALRNSGLAHLLAISGLHMMVVGGFVFLALRVLLTFPERLALTRPVRKWAALASVPVAAIYLLIADAPVSAQRAFLMFSVMMLAIVIERRALSMRNVALAAFAVLALAPESLLEAGFQMSFAAVIALIAAYEAQSDRLVANRSANGWFDRLVGGVWRSIVAISLTTIIASAATAPFAAFHFQQSVLYSLPANLAAIPLFSFVVMPFGLIAVTLMPLGLEGLPLTIMALGVEGIRGIAHAVAAWPGAVVEFGAQPAWTLVLMALGGLWFCNWRGPVRLLAAIPAFAALGVVLAAQRPDILIDEQGRLVAVRDAGSGRYFLSRKTPGFVARNWLERDGDRRTVADAASTISPGWHCDERGCILMRGKKPWLAHVRHAGALDEDCGEVRILISEEPVRGPCEGPELVIGRFDLWRKGAHAIWLARDGTAVKRVRTVASARPWSPYRARLQRSQTRRKTAGRTNSSRPRRPQ